MIYLFLTLNLINRDSIVLGRLLAKQKLRLKQPKGSDHTAFIGYTIIIIMRD